LEGVLFPHLVGSLTALILVRSFGGKGFKAIPTLPWFAFLPGILGVMAVLGLTFSTLRLGATATVVLFLVAQLIVGAVVGHFGWLGLPLKPLDPKNTERGFAVCGGLVGGEDGLSWV
jgi:transporter family-2 protein